MLIVLVQLICFSFTVRSLVQSQQWRDTLRLCSDGVPVFNRIISTMPGVILLLVFIYIVAFLQTYCPKQRLQQMCWTTAQLSRHTRE